MKLAIIIIGDEILLGQVTDTNSGHIARTFSAKDWEVTSVCTVPDDARAIREAIGRGLEAADLVISTGGLGPTKDDITKAVMLEVFGGTLRHDPDVAENISRIFEKRGLKLNDLTRAQAMVPTSCTVIQNLFGTAPVMCFEKDGKMLVVMPGVPFETEGMLPEVVSRVDRHFNPDIHYRHRTLMAGGISESALAERLDSFEKSIEGSGLHLAYLPIPGLIRLRLDGRGADKARLDADFDAAFSRLEEGVGGNMVFDGDATAAEILIDALRRNNATAATAESCTGGNIAHAITSVPGCSDVFAGAFVTYTNSMKHSVLGVSASSLEKFGAVSAPVAEQMARGAIEASGASCAVATSGIAGPGGGSAEKPVGTVWMAAAVRRPDGSTDCVAECHRFPGDRLRVIGRATTQALLMLARRLDAR